MENISLTIAIPTFNRIEQLRRTLSRLLPQLNESCFLLIIDNHSDKPVEDDVKGLLSQYSFNKVKLIRNRVNIGANPNIHRCFEECETEWMWLLSDDDYIKENAINTIFETIRQYPDAVNINFYSPHALHPKRSSTLKFYGKTGYIDSIDNFGATIFMSSNIYNISRISSFSESCHRTYSCVAQWMIVYFNLHNDSLTITSDKTIVINDFCSDRYSAYPLDIINGFISIVNVLMSKMDRKKLISKILTIEKKWISYQSLIKILLIEYYRRDKNVDVLYHIRRYYSNLYKYGSFKNTLVFIICYLTGLLSIELLYRLVKTYTFKHTNGKQDINELIKI